jgi:hypothetical protein
MPITQPRVRLHDSSVRTLTARCGVRQTTLPLAVSRRRKLEWQPLSVSSGGRKFGRELRKLRIQRLDDIAVLGCQPLGDSNGFFGYQ